MCDWLQTEVTTYYKVIFVNRQFMIHLQVWIVTRFFILESILWLIKFSNYFESLILDSPQNWGFNSNLWIVEHAAPSLYSTANAILRPKHVSWKNVAKEEETSSDRRGAVCGGRQGVRQGAGILCLARPHRGEPGDEGKPEVQGLLLRNLPVWGHEERRDVALQRRNQGKIRWVDVCRVNLIPSICLV